MKNYSLKKRDDFIINYEIKNNLIIVNLANNTKKISAYDPFIEIYILMKMKKQIINNDYEKKLKKKYYYSLKLSIVGTFFATIIGLLLLTNPIAFNIVSIIYSIFIIYTFVSIKSILGVINYKRLLKDLEKNKLFLKNEIILNREEILNNVPTLNLNDIHDISYNKLNNMIKIKKKVLKK